MICEKQKEDVIDTYINKRKHVRVDVYRVMRNCNRFPPIEIIPGDLRSRIDENTLFNMIIRTLNKHKWTYCNFVGGLLLQYYKDKRDHNICIITPRQYNLLSRIST